MAKSGGVSRKGGPAWKPKGSGSKRAAPLAVKGSGGKAWVSSPKRVVDRTSADKVDTGGGKQIRS